MRWELPDPQPFSRCLAVSGTLHLAFFLIAGGIGGWGPKPPPLEIDLTRPFIGTGPAKLGAPKAKAPQAKGPALPAEEPGRQQLTPEPPKDWTLPGPKTQEIIKPQPPQATPGGETGGTGTSPLPGGSGQGADYGVPGGMGSGGSPLSRFPQLLNRDEVLANLRRFYPESERRAGREGTVIVKIHIDEQGGVAAVDVVSSAGWAFDGAAKEVAKLMRFSPALSLSGKPLAVRVPQSMVFRLTD
ncbi:MAG: TonB family protein [Elusimicrobia bacterium]|nr:TonB family protein [Elusimicrobiota bacterium]